LGALQKGRFAWKWIDIRRGNDNKTSNFSGGNDEPVDFFPLFPNPHQPPSTPIKPHQPPSTPINPQAPMNPPGQADVSHAAYRMGILEMTRQAVTWFITAYIFLASPSTKDGTGMKVDPCHGFRKAPRHICWVIGTSCGFFVVSDFIQSLNPNGASTNFDHLLTCERY